MMVDDDDWDDGDWVLAEAMASESERRHSESIQVLSSQGLSQKSSSPPIDEAETSRETTRPDPVLPCRPHDSSISVTHLSSPGKSLPPPRPAPDTSVPSWKTIPTYAVGCNPQQVEAILYDISLPLLIIAGAGSGNMPLHGPNPLYQCTNPIPSHTVQARPPS
jgi:hypothetical protein